ncbi:flagellar basal-body rod protein FlgF [Sporolituus thermophilus]|uniref:Flagellar basal-body rod protein FlgG n=1 Tax=Sporolituus thermophilus DSM 23256 TaxID=1123285 RepID=A0A1G7HGI9_9FIRM|nr:flagellar basal-body rod protein FlgF [Sporolituus thermophilus]SDE99423.1 flagellar basal-body rod protein FlgG [Sporolituus thermophilus DSM 23256]
MIRGIYTAASGMLAEAVRTDVTANNLANANTAGYKKDVALSHDFAGILISRINDGPGAPVIGTLGLGAVVDNVATIHTTGMMRPTGNALDLAIDGPGFFVVVTPAGPRYTRNGAFTKNAGGELVTQAGYRVMGQAGPVWLGDGAKVAIDADGRIFVDEVEVDRLQVVDFPDRRALVKEGDSLFAAPGAAPQAGTGQVRQGMLELANVNVVAEMVTLIAGYRAYEINAKLVQTHDQLLDKAVNDVARV